MTSYHNALGPSRDQSWNVLANNGFPKHSASQYIPDGSIWRFPHLFQIEFYKNLAETNFENEYIDKEKL